MNRCVWLTLWAAVCLSALPVQAQQVEESIDAAAVDVAFDRYVDMDLLVSAWQSLDPGQLADVGLQLAEGERILFRSHKVARAETVLKMAIKAAAHERDQEALKRLAQAGQANGWKEIAASAAAAAKLASQARAAPQVKVDISHVSQEHVQMAQAILWQIGNRQIRGHGKALEALADELKNNEQLPNSLRKELTKAVADAGKNLPEASSQEEEMLDKLAGVSRAGWTWYFENKTGGTVHVRTYFGSFGGQTYQLPNRGKLGPIRSHVWNVNIKVRRSGGSWTSWVKGRRWENGGLVNGILVPSRYWQIRPDSHSKGLIYMNNVP